MFCLILSHFKPHIALDVILTWIWLDLNRNNCLQLYITGTQIYVLNGTDPEGQPVKYGMTFEPGHKEYFRVHPKSGTVTLIEELDREVHLKTRIKLCYTSRCYTCAENITVTLHLLLQEQDEVEVFVSISDGLNKVSIVDLSVLSSVCGELWLSFLMLWCHVR